RAIERVEVVLEELLLLEFGQRGVAFTRRRNEDFLVSAGRLHALHVAGDELERRVLVARARAVQDADPRAEIGRAVIRVVAFAVREVVVGPPRQALGLVTDPGV